MLSTPLKVLMATVGLLLLLACANLRVCYLARGASRQHEMAVRVCLGAVAHCLLRQTLTESLLLSLIGSAARIFLAYFRLKDCPVFASGRLISGLPIHLEMLKTPDVSVMLFTVAIALVTGLLCGAPHPPSTLRTQHRPSPFYRVRGSERQSVNDCSAKD